MKKRGKFILDSYNYGNFIEIRDGNQKFEVLPSFSADL